LKQRNRKPERKNEIENGSDGEVEDVRRTRACCRRFLSHCWLRYSKKP